MRPPRVVYGRLITRREPPGLAQVPTCLMQRLRCCHERRVSRQDAKTGFREAVCPEIPCMHHAARHLIAFLPDAIPVVLRQGDDEGELLQQECVVPLLPLGTAQ